MNIDNIIKSVNRLDFIELKIKELSEMIKKDNTYMGKQEKREKISLLDSEKISILQKLNSYKWVYIK